MVNCPKIRLQLDDFPDSATFLLTTLLRIKANLDKTLGVIWIFTPMLILPGKAIKRVKVFAANLDKSFPSAVLVGQMHEYDYPLHLVGFSQNTV